MSDPLASAYPRVMKYISFPGKSNARLNIVAGLSRSKQIDFGRPARGLTFQFQLMNTTGCGPHILLVDDDAYKEAEPAASDKGSGPNHFFKEQISGYEPMYFIAGSKSPNAKFQISFAYQLLNNEGPLAQAAPALKGFHIDYTQTSLWDLNGSSAPFYDTTYRPKFFNVWENATHAQLTNWFQLDQQGGLEHESNGKSGADSRSLNMAYFEPTLTIGRDEDLQLTLQPRAWIYLGSLSDNPDIKDYYGYASLRTIVGWKRGLQLSATGQMGTGADHGSVQLDLTYPTMRFFGSFSLYLDVHYFTGYGERLLGYNQRTDELRAGFALFR
jgi:phospholipase A1/A2